MPAHIESAESLCKVSLTVYEGSPATFLSVKNKEVPFLVRVGQSCHFQLACCWCCLPGMLGPGIANLTPVHTSAAAVSDGGCIAGMSPAGT